MSARFCVECGARLTVGLVAGRERPHCVACGFVVFRNPVPVGMAVVEREGRLLLIRRANPPLEGYWAPPAGHVEIDESVEAATIRETHEEAGVEVALDGLVGVYSQADIGVLIITYRGRVIGGEARAGEDATDAGFFATGELPVQPLPTNGSPVDHWFYGVIEAVTAPWKEVPSQ